MTSVGAYEAKVHLSELLDRVSRGERITITKHGHPVAVLIPAGEPRSIDRAHAIDELRAFRRGRSLGGMTVKEMIEQGRAS